MADMDNYSFKAFNNEIDSIVGEPETARSLSPICDAIISGNAKWNSQFEDFIGSKDESKKYRANSFSGGQSSSFRRPITNNKFMSGSLPKESFLNDKRSTKFTEIDASLSLKYNRNSSPVRSPTYESERKDYFYSYIGDIDQQKMNEFGRHLFDDVSDPTNNEGKHRSEPSKTRNGERKEGIRFNTATALSYSSKEQLKNSCQIAANFDYSKLTFNGSFGLYFNDPIWSQMRSSIWNELPDRYQILAKRIRDQLKLIGPSYTWSGQLPKRNRNKNPIYSCKVFLGGIPYDLTDSDLHLDFSKFGPIQIQWPGFSVKSAIDSAAHNKAGYVYVIFESYDNVTALLNACTVSYKDLDSGCRWYFNMNSRRTKMKEVQVIPFDIGDRFYMKGSFSGQMEHSKTVFVGALHGMLSADGLAKVMDDLFGGVIFAGLDTDKHKYPLGSGRVSFDNNESYMKAVSAAFVEIKSSRFKKTIQIDPYIENESICDICKVPQQSPVFCRDLACFQYYCRNCWDAKHSDRDYRNHRPIIKNKTA